MTADLRALILDAVCEAADYDLHDDGDLALYRRMRADFVGMLGQVEQCSEGADAARYFDLMAENFRRLFEWLPLPMVPSSVTDRTLTAANHWLEKFLLCEAVAFG